MSGPTKSGILGTDSNVYRPVLDGVASLAAKYEQRVSTFKGYVDRPGGTAWVGQTAEAGQANAAEGWKVAARIQDRAEKFQLTAGPLVDHTIVPNLTSAQRLIGEWEPHPDITITEPLEMIYTPPQGMSKEDADYNTELVAAAGRELKAAADTWWNGVQELKTLAEGVSTGIENEVNSSAGTFDIDKAVTDNAPGKPDTAQDGNFYKQWYPESEAPASTQAAAATAVDPNAPVQGPPSPAEAKPGAGDGKPLLGSLTGQIQAAHDPAKAAEQAKAAAAANPATAAPKPKLDWNSPEGKAVLDKTRALLSPGRTPAEVEAIIEKGKNWDPNEHLPPPKAPDGTATPHRQSGGEAFAESWDQFGRAKDDLVGNNGAENAKEAWIGVAKGLWDVVNPDPVHQVERAIDNAQGAVDEVKSGIDNPKAFLGRHGPEIAAGIATAPLGGEGALLGAEARAGLHGIDDLPGTGHHTPPVGDHTGIGGSGDHSSAGAHHAPPLSDGGGWESPSGGASLGPEHNAAANQFLEQARQAEPHITQSLRDIVGNNPGSELTGLEYRLKAEDSFKQKLFGSIDSYPNLSMAEHLAGMKDSVRYTMQSPEGLYSANTQRAIDNLIADGYEPMKFKNTWDQPGYQGINSFWRDPATGQTFEVQFHTPSSFDAKMQTHPLYEQERVPGISPQTAADLQQQQKHIFDSVPRPSGSSAISLPLNGGHK